MSNPSDPQDDEYDLKPDEESPREFPVRSPIVPQYATGPLQYASSIAPPYDSARPRARIVIASLWALIALQVLMIVPSIVTLSDLQALRAGEDPVLELRVIDFMQLGLGLLYLAVVIFSIVYWMMWVHRLYRNLPALGARDLDYSPGWAVGYYFIPILNLFRPYQVMKQTWQASSNQYGGGNDWQRVVVPGLIAVWWGLHLFSSFGNQTSFRIGMRSEDLDLLYIVAWFDLFLLLFDCALAFVEIKLVQQLTQMQEQRAADDSEMMGLVPAAGNLPPPLPISHR